MSPANRFTKQFDLKYPIIQAPMAGGGDTPELVAAVSNAGALGFIGAAYLNPEQIAAAGAAVRELTSRPFGVNLFAPTPAPNASDRVSEMLLRLQPYFAELGLPAPEFEKTNPIGFDAQLEAALEIGASIFSFTFGMLPDEAIREIKAKGLYLMGTATTVDEALALEQAGVDAVVAQGAEAGGHRGTFLHTAGLHDFTAGMVGGIALIPQIADAVRVPVIASGGIMDGRGIVAALALGASAVQMGTAFLTCRESGVPEVYREAILSATENQTQITRAFSGRPARGIVYRFLREMGDDDAILPFPLQNALTRPLRNAARKQGRAEFLSLWAGQGVRLARRQSASELVERLGAEMRAAMAKLPNEAG